MTHKVIADALKKCLKIDVAKDSPKYIKRKKLSDKTVAILKKFGLPIKGN